MTKKRLPIDIQKFLERLERVRLKMGLTQKAFAINIGVNPRTIIRWRKGESFPDALSIGQISKALGCSRQWLMYGEGAAPYTLESPRPPSKLMTTPQAIPVFGNVPAGFPMEIHEEIIDYIKLPDMPNNCYALKVVGKSMKPTVQPGDYVIFVLDQNIASGDIVIVNNEWGESMVKRYRVKNGQQILESDNPEYPPVKPNEHYRIVGKVIDAWRPLNLNIG